LVTRRVADADAPVGIRALQRSCRGLWVSAWALRGCLDRAVAAGNLVPAATAPGGLTRLWCHCGDTPKELIM
ncbi:MAG TPA: hypothetical protein VEQ09_03245, partial [Aquabacterium sp.]|nr:hypothetical protein [Aquabacterium sp.]